MLKKIGHWAVELAQKHPVLNAAVVAVGAVTIVEGVITVLKPKSSTSQSTGG